MLITDNVYSINATRGSYVFALRLPDGVTLIDTSFPGRADRIAAELTANGLDDVVRILVTHHDVDHVGNATKLQKRFGCNVFISATDMPYAQGATPRHGVKRLIGGLMRAGRTTRYTALPEGEIDGVKIIPTPGHTPGHTCYLFNRVLFAGDLLNSKGGALRPSQPLMTWNKQAVDESIAALAGLEFDVVCPAHGEPVKTSRVG